MKTVNHLSKLFKFGLSNEDVLIKKCIDREKKAWDVFVEKYNRLIYNAIIKTINKYSYSNENQIIDDIFQTVFLSLIDNNCKKLRQFQGKCKLSSWLHIISVRATIDFIKKKAIKLSINGETGEEQSLREKITNGNPLPDKILDQKEGMKIFEAIKSDLNTKEQLFVELYYCRELPPDEVSKIMSITKNNVYQIKNRVKGKMRELAKDFL